MTLRGAPLGKYKNLELSFPMTSEQTALICWGPKGSNEMKMGLIQRQSGRRVPNATHNITSVGSPARAEHDVLGVILGVFLPIQATFVFEEPVCDVGTPS